MNYPFHNHQRRTTLQHYDCLKGWESPDQDGPSNILKKFRTNLNQYQDHYKERKIKQEVYLKKIKQSQNLNKQNSMKLPFIQQLPLLPLKQQLLQRGSYLALRHRNILQEAIDSQHNKQRSNGGSHEAINKVRFKINEPKKQMKIINIRKQIKEENGPENCRVFRSQTYGLKERKDKHCFIRLKAIESRQRRQLAQSQFSDQKLVLCQHRQKQDNHPFKSNQ